MLRLHFNENPHGVNEEVWKLALERLADVEMQWYPDREASGLRRALAEYAGVDGGRLVVANGSDDILHLLLLAHLHEIQRVVIPTPTFGMYRATAEVLGLEVVEVPLDPSFGLNVEQIVHRLQEAPSAVFVCYPNNPTGNYFERDAVEQIRKAGPRLVIADEAYYEFGGRSWVQHTAQDPKLAVVRTLSKAFGVAGLRVGYAIAHESLSARLRQVRQPFNLNAASQILAQTVVEHASTQLQTVQEMRRLRERMREKLSAIAGLTPLPSVTNFFLVEVDDEEFGLCAADIQAQLKEGGILVRYLPHLPRCIRVSVGLPRQADELSEQLELIRA